MLDFISRVHSFPNLTSFGTFGHAVSWVLSAGHKICSRVNLHVVLIAIWSHPLKLVQGFVELVELELLNSPSLLETDTPVPKQLDKFWTSPTNKTKLQQHARQLPSTPELTKVTVVLSGCMTDDRQVLYTWQKVFTTTYLVCLWQLVW